MIETYGYTGVWWLPEDETRQLTGTLTVTRGAAELEVFNDFGHDPQSSSAMPSPVPRILGLATEGKEITLEGCWATNFVLSTRGIPITTYRAQFALVGAWFVEGEETTFDEIAIKTTELDTWAFVSGFSQSFSGQEDADSGLLTTPSIDIHFESPDAIVIPLDHGEEARVEYSMRYSGLSPVTSQVELSQAASLHLRYASPKELPRVGASVIRLRNFLSLAVGKPISVLSVKGFRDDFLQEHSGTRRPIEILWELPTIQTVQLGLFTQPRCFLRSPTPSQVSLTSCALGSLTRIG